MASLTQTRKNKEKNRARSEGKPRKRSLAAGSTPRFPVHLDQEPDCVIPMPPGSHPSETRN